MDKHLDILNDLYYWFYTKYNNEDINTEKLRRVSDKTITYYLEHDIILGTWQWECDITKQIHEKQKHV